MRAALRATTALLLVAPLTIAAVPASASVQAPTKAPSSQTMYKAQGSFADVYYDGPMDSDYIPGNYVFLGFTVHSDYADGFADAFECAEGETPWEGEEPGCDYLGSYFLAGDDVTLTKGKGKTGAATVSGVVDVYDIDWDTGESGLVAEDAPVDLAMTPTGATSRTTVTDVYRDPVNGVSYRSRETQTTQFTTVSGSVAGVDVDGAEGRFGSYRVHYSERIA
jgi:hypothetical protein